MDTHSPHKHAPFTSVLLVLHFTHFVRPIFPLISDHMHPARYEAMDAQRFDPLRRMKTVCNLVIPSAEEDMGQVLRRLSQPNKSPNGVVGGVWSDHEMVLVPLEVAPTRHSLASALAASESVSSTSTSSPPSVSPSTASSSSYFTTPSPTAESVQGPSSSSLPSSCGGTHQVETSESEDLIITRTIIHPATHMSRSMSSRPATPAVSRPISPPPRPNSPVLQVLNCFRPMALGRGVGDVQQTERSMAVANQPVLQVIVTQTRGQYERDLAFKEVVQEVYPEACRRRGSIH